jgi:membrane associated rhomboid family serine protease
MPSFLRRPLRYRYYNATFILIVVNLLVFFFALVTSGNPWLYLAGYLQGPVRYICLYPDFVLYGGGWWQVVTYMFVHGGFWHILLNMFVLFSFGIQLERHMGSAEFLLFYFFCGIGAGLATVFINSWLGMGTIPVVGASGAIVGLLLAFASFFPDARVFLLGIFPMRAPTMVLVFVALEVLFFVTGKLSGVAHLTHLAGIAFAYLYIVVRFGINPISVFFRRQ